MSTILDLLRDARDEHLEVDRDSSGMVKVYPRHGRPIIGWVTRVEDDGSLVWMVVAVEPPDPHPRSWTITGVNADHVGQGDYEIAVRIDDLYAVRFTDLHEFVSNTSY